MEEQLFTFVDYDPITEGIVQYEHVTLVRDIFDLKEGQTFRWAAINTDESTLSFGIDETSEPFAVFDIQLQVVGVHKC
jgi:hypothetical protein